MNLRKVEKSSLINLNNNIAWQSYLDIFPALKKDVYFTPFYYEIAEKNNEGSAKCFVFENDGEIVLYPFLLNEVPAGLNTAGHKYYDIQGAYGYNGLIATSGNESIIKGFYQAFNDYCKDSNIIAEFTRFHPLLENQLLSKDYLTVIFDRKTVFIDLELAYEAIWSSQYSGINRNMIRKAEKTGVIITEAENWNEYLAFHGLYTETMKNVGADSFYFFDENYFRNFFENLKGNNKLFLAFYEGKMIAGSMFMYYGTTIHYHLSARDSDYSNMAANNFILDYAVKWAIEKGLNNFFLGGGTNSDETNSLLKFKANFSRERKDFFIGKKIHNPEIYNKVVLNWENNNPEKKEMYKNHLLKYRY